MKYTSMFVFMIVTTTIVGCSTVIPVQQARPTAMRQPDMAMFGRGRAPIPPRVPVRRGQAAYGVSAPFSDIVFTFRLMNNVRIDGDPDKTGIITRVWVAGVDKPLAHFASQIKIWNQPRIVPWHRRADRARNGERAHHRGVRTASRIPLPAA